MSYVDDWTVTTDGTLAIVRGQNYHVDWVMADGTIRSTPRMPFDWRRLSDSDKKSLVDSAVALARSGLDSLRRKQATVGSGRGVGIVGSRAVGGSSTPIPADADIIAVPLNEIVDYAPAFHASAVQADADGHLWILPLTSRYASRGGLVYDVVNQGGELFERVQLPAGRSVVGFGPGGAVYMGWRDDDRHWHLERTRVQR